MIGHTLRHGGKLHSLITEGMVDEFRSRRSRTRHISQIKKNVRVTSYKTLKQMASDREI